MMTGRCLCGAVTFTAEEVETDHGACHCGMCQRWSSCAFLAARCKGVTFTGDALRTYASSAWAHRGFCATCGTLLYYFLEPAQRHAISVGAFDDQAPFRLAIEIFIDRKPAGHAFTGDHPRWTEAETLARFAAPPA
ncbi:MAG TPA: GFA family protein [Kofleriaceae bacterium]|nr:GFA family protein [Kofleriaceae bacterium]